MRLIVLGHHQYLSQLNGPWANLAYVPKLHRVIVVDALYRHYVTLTSWKLSHQGSPLISNKAGSHDGACIGKSSFIGLLWC